MELMIKTSRIHFLTSPTGFCGENFRLYFSEIIICTSTRAKEKVNMHYFKCLNNHFCHFPDDDQTAQGKAEENKIKTTMYAAEKTAKQQRLEP